MSTVIKLAQIHAPPIAKPSLRVADIQQAVANHYGIARQDIISPRRASARPRHVAMYLAKRLTEKSYPQIARAFDRDHSTIIYGVNRIRPMLADRVLRRDICRIVKGLSL